VIVILVSGMALAVLFSSDVLLVKDFFAPDDAGKYATVAALGRAIFWAVGGIALVLFPKAVATSRNGGGGSVLVLASMGMCLVGGVMAWAVFSLEPRFLLTTFAGPAYAPASSYLPMYGVAMTLLGSASVLVATSQARSTDAGHNSRACPILFVIDEHRRAQPAIVYADPALFSNDLVPLAEFVV
jgi:O-antigen/teichoic acid export membrane protein